MYMLKSSTVQNTAVGALANNLILNHLCATVFGGSIVIIALIILYYMLCCYSWRESDQAHPQKCFKYSYRTTLL